MRGTDFKSPKAIQSLTSSQLIDRFLKSRTQGLSPRTLQFYQGYLERAKGIVGIDVAGQEVKEFIDILECSNGGKHGYFRVLRAFYNWLYSRKSGLGLNSQDNPILLIEAPKVERKILPSLTPEQIELLIREAANVRDKAIVSLFADSGLRLSELANIYVRNVDWANRLIKVRCKGGKEALAVFGQRTESFLREWLSQHHGDKLWDVTARQIVGILDRLKDKTGLPCNPHTFRRSFASILAKRGIDSLHIMRLGRWESIAMVDRYTKSVKFDDSLKLYSPIVN